MSRRLACMASTFLVALVGAACAADETETVPGGLGYAVEFPSKQAAIASESLKVYVFAADQDCLTLIQRRKSGGALPAPLAETAAAPVCDYFSGAAGGTIELAAGTYVVLAVAQRQNRDFLLGCVESKTDATTTIEPVQLTLADETVGVPASSCTLLADKCGNRC